MPYKNLEITPTKYSNDFTVTKQSYYKGFSTQNKLNKTSKIYDYDLIKQNILNHFNTRKGSRVMNPTFGTIIWDLLMEPLTDENKNALITDIETICRFDPRCNPIQIDISEYEHGYFVEITLELKNTNQTEVLKLAFDQKIGLVAE